MTAAVALYLGMSRPSLGLQQYPWLHAISLFASHNLSRARESSQQHTPRFTLHGLRCEESFAAVRGASAAGAALGWG